MAKAAPTALYDDPDLASLTDDQKRAIVSSRLQGLVATLYGAKLDRAGLETSVDVPDEARDAQLATVDARITSLRSSIAQHTAELDALGPAPE